LINCFEIVEFVQAETDVELLVTVPFENVSVVLPMQLFSSPFSGVTSSEMGKPPYVTAGLMLTVVIRQLPWIDVLVGVVTGLSSLQLTTSNSDRMTALGRTEKRSERLEESIDVVVV
jgi:hypothetical protein